MNFMEAEIAKCERRIKKIEQNPDPTLLGANKLRYELERDLRKAQLLAWSQGKPLGEGDGQLRPLLRAMGFELLDLTRIADRLPAGEKYLQIASQMGFPSDACDRTIMTISLVALGEVPVPNFIVSTNSICDPVMVAYRAVSDRFGIPRFHIDVPWGTSEQNLSYVTSQIRELIRFVEARFPGLKYDESKLIELQDFNRRADELNRQMYLLRKRVPCPIGGRDVFRVPRSPSFYPDPEKAAECENLAAKELQERADKGIGVVDKERLRLMWLNAAPSLFDPIGYLNKQGVSVPMFYPGVSLMRNSYGDETEYGRKLSPLEEVARGISNGPFWAKGRQWVNEVLFYCRDLKLDGIVNFLQSGCVATLGLAKLVEDSAQQELGIPTLHIQGRMLEGTGTQQEMEAKLDEFVDICISSKKVWPDKDASATTIS